MNWFKSVLTDNILRRYLVTNTFDCVLGGIGILVALLVGGIMDARTVIISCFGAGVAMGVSGFWGVYLVERAELKHSVLKAGLEHTKALIDEHTKHSIITGFFGGFIPFISVIVLIIPFFIFPVTLAFYISFILSGLIIASLGIFIAKISKENITISAIKMLIASIIVVAIIYVTEKLRLI